MSAHLSHSQIEGMADCGEKYRLSRIVRAPERPAMWNVGGHAFHGAAEWLERERFAGREPSADLMVWEFLRQFEHELSEVEARWAAEHGGAVGPMGDVPWRFANQARAPEDDVWWREHGAAMCRTYWHHEDDTEIAALPDGSPALEVAFNVLIAGVPFKGFIDQVRRRRTEPSGALIIRDLKAGKSTPGSTAQLGEYGVALRLAYPEMGDHVAMYGDYYMARKGHTTGRVQLAAAHPYADVTYAVATASWMRDAGLFLPRVSSFCKSCGVREFCRYVGGERVSEVPAPSAPHFGLALPESAD